jgi:hypothetical protein
MALPKLSVEEIDALEPRWPAGAASWVWQHGCLRDGQQIIVCFHCGHQMNFVNPSNMATHLESIHKLRDLSKVQKKRPREPVGIDTALAAVALSPARREKLNHGVVLFVATAGVSFDVTQTRAFKRLLEVISPQISLITH